MKVRKGICLILCILFLSGLVPLRAAAVSGECVDGVWASIALTGGANKLIFTADGADLPCGQQLACLDQLGIERPRRQHHLLR